MRVLSDANNLDLNFGGGITLNRASNTREMFNLHVGGTLTRSPGTTTGLALTGSQTPSGTGAIVKIQAGDIAWDSSSGYCAITANDGASSASDFVWILPTCTASGNLECQMILGEKSAHGTNFSLTNAELATIDMNGGSGHGNLILGDVHPNEPITGGIATTTAVDVIQVTNVTLATAVANNVYLTANRHANSSRNVNFVTTPSTFAPDLIVRASGDITVGSTGGIDMTKASGTLTLHAEYDCYNTTRWSNKLRSRVDTNLSLSHQRKIRGKHELGVVSHTELAVSLVVLYQTQGSMQYTCKLGFDVRCAV